MLAPILWIAVTLSSSDAGSPASTCTGSKAVSLLEQGRRAQRERGEDGADAAIRAYRSALALEPGCAAAWWELGWSYQTKGDWERNLDAWTRLKKVDPSYPELAEQFELASKRRDQSRSLERLPALGKPPTVDEQPEEGASLTIAAVGDVHMGMAWPPERAKLPPDGGSTLFSAVTSYLQPADIAFGNLETVLADSGESRKCGKNTGKCFAFRVPTPFAGPLKAAGFDVMSIANNHAGDFGAEGRRTTMAALDAVGILHSGPVGDVASFEVKGRKVALLAFSTGQDVYRLTQVELAQRLVADLAQRHDLVVVSFHGGAEGDSAQHLPGGPETFYGEARGDVRDFAHKVIDAGADLVLGHGPHVLRAVEVYRGRAIAYSMGNFSSWETFGLAGAKGVSGVFHFTLAPNGVVRELRVDPIVLKEPGVPQPDPEKRALRSLRQLSKEDLGTELLDEDGVWRHPSVVGAR